MSKQDYVTRVFDSPQQIDAESWNHLLALQAHATPFMRHEYLAAMDASGSASPAAGWTPRFVTLWDAAGALQAACPLYLKDHSYGEYVFDWAWANAYARHGIDYYPKALVAVPFTPVPGCRLLARNADARAALLRAVLSLCDTEKLSSLHLLFGNENDLATCTDAGLMARHTVQFHWQNRRPAAYGSFDDFLATLSQDKRKKIRQERRKVNDAGVSFRRLRGGDISVADWDFFYRCYERTYLEHGNLPYLNRAFFTLMAQEMPQHWLLFIAEREGRPIAASLIAVQEGAEKIAWGRYWGALERVDCLHFEACYYQPLQWCIEHGYQRFEGGAQGEHKLARALLPVRADSAHWLAHPDFAQAVEDFLAREGPGVALYLDELARHTPFKRTD